MDGVGSRLGRVSSRYGPTTAFNGPVRKWKKQWVHVSSPLSSSTVSYRNSSRSGENGNSDASSLLLCRWTPINAGDSDKSSGGKSEEPPRRKFRYTPIVVLEEQKKESAKEIDNEAKPNKANQFTARPAFKHDDIHEKSHMDNLFMEENQASFRSRLPPQQSEKSNLDLDLCMEVPDDAHDSDGENKEAQLGRTNPRGFWAFG